MTAVWMESTSVCSVCTERSRSLFTRLLKVCFLEEDDASVSSMLLSSMRHPYLFMHRKQHHLSRLVHKKRFIIVHRDGLLSAEDFVIRFLRVGDFSICRLSSGNKFFVVLFFIFDSMPPSKICDYI